MGKIYIHEVGPRDGLQMGKTTIPLEEKICWIVGLVASGAESAK
jgi:isopropylmalate/homocitrate/citramalate synthase